MSVKRTFVSTVDVLRKGHLSDELNDKLRELVLAVAQSGKSGSISLTIKIKPASKGGPLEVHDDVKMTLPRPDRSSTYLYNTDDGGLTRNDPAQEELPGIRAVEDAPAPIRNVG